MSNLSFQPVPLALEVRSTIPTQEAAYHLNRANQTLRVWAMRESYPPGLKPMRINGRLSWPVSGIKAAVGVSA